MPDLVQKGLGAGEPVENLSEIDKTRQNPEGISQDQEWETAQLPWGATNKTASLEGEADERA